MKIYYIERYRYIWTLTYIYMYKWSHTIGRTDWNQEESRGTHARHTGRAFIIYHWWTIFSSCWRVGVKGFRVHWWQVSPSPAGHTAGETQAYHSAGKGKEKRKKQAWEESSSWLHYSLRHLIRGVAYNYWEKHEQENCRRGDVHRKTPKE